MMALPELVFSEVQSINRYYSVPTGVRGLYLIFDEKMILMYVGKASGIRNRLAQHFHAKGKEEQKVYRHYVYFSYTQVDDPVDREIYETYYINKLRPKLNKSKVFTYKSSYNEFVLDDIKREKEEHVRELRLKLSDLLEKIAIIV